MNDTLATILKNNNYCTLATVTPEGAPWAVPVHFSYDAHNIYWVSSDQATHSQNIAANGHVFITVFNSHQTAETADDRGAVYISTQASKLMGDEAAAARSSYLDRYPEDGDRKLSEWSVYGAPIGELDSSRTKGQLVYFRHEEGSNA